MARKNKTSEIIRNPREYRQKHGLGNQQEFWAKFGVTQSGGSRYENNRVMPVPLQLLMALYDMEVITDKDLEKAKACIG